LETDCRNKNEEDLYEIIGRPTEQYKRCLLLFFFSSIQKQNGGVLYITRTNLMKSLLSKKNQENFDSLKLTINDIENYKLNFNSPS
jgi:hypothetical protein